MKRRIFSEKNLVAVLFVMVFVVFYLAEEDTRKMEKNLFDSGVSAASAASSWEQPVNVTYKIKEPVTKITFPATQLR